MSIAPPSDIVLDVAQAADPARRQAAVQKLAELAAKGGTPPSDFNATLASATPANNPGPGKGVAVDRSLLHDPLGGAGHSRVTVSSLTPYQKFEAMMLQSFVEQMLPKESELYGDAASTDMCRSLMAEKIAQQLAKSGRIGVAKSIERFETATAGASAATPQLTTLQGAATPLPVAPAPVTRSKPT